MGRQRKTIIVNNVAIPLRHPGGYRIRWDGRRNTYIVGAWPKGNGGDTPKRAAARQMFSSVQKLIKYAAAEDWNAAKTWSDGTKFLPRDLLFSAATGSLLEWVDQDGQKWKGLRVAQKEIQTLLASISNTPGVMLVNLDGEWVALLPGGDGEVLTFNGAAQLPEWQPNAGGGGGGDLTLIGTYTADAATHTNIDFGLPTNVDNFEVIVRGKIGSSNGNFGVRLSNDGGASFHSGASDYKDANNSSNSWMNLSNGTTCGAGRPYLCRFTFSREADGTNFIMTGTVYSAQSTGVLIAGHVGGCGNPLAITPDAMRIAASVAGNANDITVSLYKLNV